MTKQEREIKRVEMGEQFRDCPAGQALNVSRSICPR
jgi:hypothetical protein